MAWRGPAPRRTGTAIRLAGSRGGRIIVVNIIVFAALFVLAEVGVRIFRPDYECFERTYPGEYADRAFTMVTWPRRDPDLGWVCRNDVPPGFGNPKFVGHDAVYVVNRQGFRNAADFDTIRSRPESTRVMLLGESFMFGVYLGEKDTITAYLREGPGSPYEFYNLAIPGWGVDQMVLAYREYVETIKPHVVILFYIDEDVSRVYQAFRKREGMSKPCFELRDGQLVPRGPARKGLLEQVVDGSVFLSTIHRLFAERRSNRIVKAFFSELSDHTATAGRQLFVVRCPLQQDFERQNAIRAHRFDRFFEERPGVCFDLYDPMAALSREQRDLLYLKDDMHLSAEGSRFVAKFFLEYILKPHHGEAFDVSHGTQGNRPGSGRPSGTSQP